MIGHGLHPEVCSCGGSRAACMRDIARNNATNRTPRPWTLRSEAGLLARGSSHPFSPSRSMRLQWLFRTDARRLQLRGQLRHCCAPHGRCAPYSRLSSDPCESREPRTLDIVYVVKIPSTNMNADHENDWGLRPREGCQNRGPNSQADILDEVARNPAMKSMVSSPSLKPRWMLFWIPL